MSRCKKKKHTKKHTQKSFAALLNKLLDPKAFQLNVS